MGAGSRTVFEQPGFPHPQVHDAVFVDEVVPHGLDEAGMRLRLLVGGGGLDQLAGAVVDVVVALARAVDAVGPVQAGVEPLRRIGCRSEEHTSELQSLMRNSYAVFCLKQKKWKRQMSKYNKYSHL